MVLYQAMPPPALDWLSTSVALKSHNGRKAPGSVAASVIALIISCCALKYACSVISLAGAGAGTLVPFGSITAARALPPARAMPPSANK